MHYKRTFIFVALFVFSHFTGSAQHTAPRKVTYHLYISDTMVNFTGVPKHALAVNGQLPGPALHFTEGDTADIYVHNTLKTESSIHWHGLILPNEYDGVPYLTTAPIEAGSTHHYKFPLVQSGTYWYHSHTGLQEQMGLYGAFIIHKKEPAAEKEITILLSDWTNQHPMQVNRALHNATDWYAIKKKSTQNYFQAIKEGYLKTKVINEWKRMLAMDVSDVWYDRLLTNGQTIATKPDIAKGDTVRLRIINGSASTYFWIHWAGGKMDVIANDGADVVPVAADRFIIGVSETYDVRIVIPDSGSYELLATSEDRTNHTSLWLGEGNQQAAKPLPKLKYFEGMKMMNGMMKMNGDMAMNGMEMTNQVMDMNTVMYPEVSGHADGSSPAEPPPVTLNYGMLRAPVKTTLPGDEPFKELRFNLTGNMNRYVWTINNKTVSETDKILIKKGEKVRIILYNGTMMRHPMHLHGHFFRLLNGHGDYSPLKTVVDIMPMETDTLEFAATESGDWFFHCHILYHMMSGMGRIFTYIDSPPNPQIPNPDKAIRKLYADDRMLYLAARVGLESSGSDGEITLSNTRYKLQTEWRLGRTREMGYESESHLGRYLGKMQHWLPYIGWDFRYRANGHGEKNLLGQSSTKDQRAVFCAGIQYTLPLLITADARIDMEGKMRVQLMREDIPLTSRLRGSFMLNTDKEYMAGLRYIVSRWFSLSTHYDSDMGYGAGITLNY
jgi:FtsP/CotA-like multicopper oxidase with cupredoxin domain